jgi:5-methylcytosine-specific restriction endonuclease McrA
MNTLFGGVRREHDVLRPESGALPPHQGTQQGARNAAEEVYTLLRKAESVAAPLRQIEPLASKPWQCDACKSAKQDGETRYKCLTCPNIDLCEKCEALDLSLPNTPTAFQHPNEHALVKLRMRRASYGHLVQDKSKIVHEHIRCNGCQSMPIVGFRYKCGVCSNFDMCEMCETRHEHPQDHPTLKLMQPVQ